MKLGAVIVAAGMSSRMKAFKPMLPLGDATIIRREIMTLKQTGVEDIVVVTGNNDQQLQEHIKDYGVSCIYNADYANTQMYDSACIGLRDSIKRCEKIFFLPVDVPLFSTISLKSMLEHMGKYGVKILRPTYNGKPGHPILLHASAVNYLLDYQGDDGLRGAIGSYLGSVDSIELPDRGMVIDADTPEDYQKIVGYEKNSEYLSPMSYSLKISLIKQKKFFGPGIAQLLLLVDETGSLQTACEKMYISYSKAWKIIKIAENELGIKLLYRKIGGVNGGGSVLTYEGRELITRFLSFQKEAYQMTHNLFSKYFLDYFKEE